MTDYLNRKEREEFDRGVEEELANDPCINESIFESEYHRHAALEDDPDYEDYEDYISGSHITTNQFN